MISVSKVRVGVLSVNCYVVTDKASGRTAVIDPGELNGELDALLQEIGYDKVDLILLTHGHFDHIGGVKALKEKTQGRAKVCLYKDEKKLANDPYLNLSLPFCGEPLSNTVDVDTELNDGDEIKLGESVFKVLFTPGHTSGGVCYICDHDIFSGDTLFCRSVGRTDFPTSDMSRMKDSLKKLAALDGDYEVHPGHNSETTLVIEKACNPYFE